MEFKPELLGMTTKDDLVAVVELACLTEDRTDQEQHALLRVAVKLDKERNAQVVTNRRTGPASRLLEVVETTRVLDEGQRVVALPAKTRASWADRVQRWEAGLSANAPSPHIENVATGDAL